IRNMWSALDWQISAREGLTGTQANHLVNLSYSHLNEQLLNYMGGPPWVANWFTFGKWASHEAGAGIRNLSAGASGMKDLLPTDWLTMAINPIVGASLYLATHGEQMAALAEVMMGDGMVKQVLHLLFTVLGMPYPSSNDVSSESWWVDFLN